MPPFPPSAVTAQTKVEANAIEDSAQLAESLNLGNLAGLIQSTAVHLRASTRAQASSAAKTKAKRPGVVGKLVSVGKTIGKTSLKASAKTATAKNTRGAGSTDADPFQPHKKKR